MKSVKKSLRVFIPVISIFFIIPAYAQQAGFSTGNSDINARYAREEFRVGVQAYHRFAFNESILAFERALSFKPDEPLILDWLGRAYYRSGIEESALRQWRSAAFSSTPQSAEYLLLNSRVETVQNSRNLLPIADDAIRYVESGRYPGIIEKQVLYRQPTSVLPLEDGSVWVVAYGSNELIRIDANGVIRQRQRGPVNGFDRPYDIARGLDGRLYVSEYKGNRVSILNAEGGWSGYIGAKGRGDGMFVGPQNLTIDESGYLYVVDYGNQRVSKFDPDGQFILSFGKKTFSPIGLAFDGFLSPTGIAARDGRIYVADNALNQIAIFDQNGGYLGVLVKEGLTSPESLRFLSDGRLLLIDQNRVLLIDVDSAIARVLGSIGNDKVKLVGAEIDRNNNVLVCNFQENEVSIMTRLDDMASGLFVQIERIVSGSFPTVTLEISVQDRLRRPIVGLDSRNFMISEDGKPVLNQRFLDAGYRAQTADIAILVERSEKTVSLREDISAAIRDISAASSRIISFISASEQPSKEQINEGVLPSVINGTAYSGRWRFDLGLRLAATDLLPAEKKRAVVFVGSGALGELAFERYGLSELAAYLANNGIVFHAVIIGNGRADASIEYLCAQTGGQVLPLYRSEGVKPAIQSLASNPNGTYIFSYQSQLPTDFGNAYLPVEAEVYLMERSGRDKSGYFAPLR
jgi:DNA-binding beta-propeller fold protein YncE